MTNPAGRRYLRRFIPSMISYVLLLFAALWAIERYEPTGPLLAALSLLPALPLMVVIWAIGMFIVEQPDEYLRMRQVRQVLIATAFMLVACTAWGFLEIGGAVPHLPLYWAFILWCFGLFFEPVAAWISDRRGQE